MAAPTFELSTFSSEPTLTSKLRLENGVNVALAELWNDLAANIGKIFGSRQSAINAGQVGIPGSFGVIATREGADFVIRGPGQTTDQLFETFPYWGEFIRIQSGDWNGAITNLTRNTGKTFSSRDAAVAVGQENLPPILGPILVRNGDYLELRGPGQTGDALFETYPQWGVMDRFPDIGALDSAITGVSNSIGKIFANRQAAVDAGQGNIPNNYARIITVEGNYFVLRGPNQPEDPLFEGFPNWGIIDRFPNSGLSLSTFRSNGVIRLENVGGTGDAITADFPSGNLAALTAFTSDSTQGIAFRFRVGSENENEAPTITVAGTTRTLVDSDLGTLPANFLKTNRMVVFETYGSQLARLIVSMPSIEDVGGTFDGVLKTTALLDGGLQVVVLGEDGDLWRIYPDGNVIRLRAGSDGAMTADGLGYAIANDSHTADAVTRAFSATDRFQFTEGGMRIPTLMKGSTPREAMIISIYGQSNGDVSNTGEAPRWQVPVWNFHTFMLNDRANDMRGGLKGWEGVVAPGSTGIVPADPSLSSTRQFYSESAFALYNKISDGPHKAACIRASSWGGQPIIGGSGGGGIWKYDDGSGSVETFPYTQSYINWQQDLLDMYTHMTALGFEVTRLPIFFTHQEENWQTDRQTYTDQFNGMKADIEAYVASNLPGVSVHWFCDQASGSGLRTPKYQGNAWPDRMSIVDICNQHENMTMVMPRYWLTFGYEADGVTQEDIHHSKQAKVWQGETFGYCMEEVYSGREWKCPYPSNLEISGNSVIATYELLEGSTIVVDPSFCKVRSDMGFQLWDGASEIQATGARVTGHNQVTIDFPSAPVAGQFLRYAYRTQDANDVSDEWPIGTGAVRDSLLVPSLFDPGKMLPLRAALGFEIEL